MITVAHPRSDGRRCYVIAIMNRTKGATFAEIMKWRCIRDDKGRIIVAICHNMDLGDAWEWSDDLRYDEKWAASRTGSR